MQTVEIYTSTALNAENFAAAGVVVRDLEGRTLVVFARALGRMSRDEAGYRALLAGLWRAKRIGAQRVRVYTDDAEVIAQVQGHGALPPALVGLYLQVRAMLNAYRWRRLEWIERAQNADAAVAALEALERAPAPDDVDSLPLWQGVEQVLV